MNENPLISIAMTCFNQSKYVGDAIKSIASQTYSNWQIVIVDDCSSDNSLDIVQKCVDNYCIQDKIKIIKRKNNCGYGTSLGLAITSSDGELVAVVDSDDALADNDVLEICVKVHIDHPDIVMTYSNYWICREDLSRKKVYKTRQIPNDKMYLGCGGIRVSHLKVLKKKFYMMTDGINPKLKQTVDKELSLRMDEVGRFLHIDKALYHYRHHPGNLSRSINKKDAKYRQFVTKMRKQIYEDARKRRKL